MLFFAPLIYSNQSSLPASIFLSSLSSLPPFPSQEYSADALLPFTVQAHPHTLPLVLLVLLLTPCAGSLPFFLAVVFFFSPPASS